MSEQVVAVYDISSSAVGCAHVLLTKENSVLLSHARIHLPVSPERDMTRLIEETVRHLAEVVATLQAQDVHHPTHIQVLLSSPWYLSQLRTVTYTKETPFACTPALIESIIEKEIAQLLAEEKATPQAFGVESVVVERHVALLTLNGYSTQHPFSKHATSLELTLSITLAPSSVLERFTDVLRRAYGTRVISFATALSAGVVVYRDLFPYAQDAIVLDIGEEMTDVAFVKAGALLYQHTFPVGTFALTRVLSNAFPPEEIPSILEAYRLQKLSPAIVAAVEGSLMTFASDWQRGFQNLLAEGNYGFCAPSEIVLTVDPRYVDILTNVLSKDEFLKHHCTTTELTIRVFDESLLHTHIRSIDQTTLDIPLAIGALYIPKAFSL